MEYLEAAADAQQKVAEEVVRYHARKAARRSRSRYAALQREMEAAFITRLNLQRMQMLQLYSIMYRHVPRIWMKPRCSCFYETIVMSENYSEMLENFRMTKEVFFSIVEKVRSDMEPHPKTVRTSLTAEKKCAIAIYKLASCAEYRSVGNLFGVHRTTVKRCVDSFCCAMIKRYGRAELKLPDAEESQQIAEAFRITSNLPSVVGAIDGTHIPITPQRQGALDFTNRKQWASVVVQAVVDDKYLFRNLTCQHPGRVCDATVLKDSGLYEVFPKLEMPYFQLAGKNCRSVIIGDAAYPLLPWLLKPYVAPSSPEQHTFNGYFSKARVVVENAFGRLKSRWRILQKRLDVNIHLVPKVVFTCCILHNILEKAKVGFKMQWKKEYLESMEVFKQPEDILEEDVVNVEGAELRDFLKNHLANNFPAIMTKPLLNQ